MSLLIGFLPGVGSPVRQASPLYSRTPSLSRSIFISVSDSKSLSLSFSLPCSTPRVSLLPFDYFPGHLRILRTSRLPQVLYLLRLATLVSAWRAHTRKCIYAYTRTRRSRIGRRAVTHATGGFPSLIGATPV